MVIVAIYDIRLPQVSISDASAPETDRFLWFDITLDKPAANAVYVSMALESGTAKYGDDFIRLSSSVKIPAGQTSVQYRVYVFGDNTPEGPETFTARIIRVHGGPAEAHAIQRAATGTITEVAAPQNTQPEVSIASDGDIIEGGAASFTLTASPAPASALSVSVSVTQSGDFGVTTGARTVSIPTSGTYTLTVATTNDSADEADGSVTATVNTGTGYTVSSSGGAATVAVTDNDDPPAEKIEQTCKLPSDAMSVAEITGWRDALDSSRAGAGIKRFNRVLATLGVDTGEIPMPVEQAQAVSNWLKNTRWDRTARTLEALDQCDDPPPATPTPTPPPTPEISIASDGDVTEGSAASFTITASPAPAADISVSVSVSQSGDYGVTTGAQTITIPATGSFALTVATTDDSTDEADGSVTTTVSSGTGYTVSTSASAAMVAVSDDDDPPVVTPVITIAAGSAVTEGSDATFTVTATPNPTSVLTVNLTVSENGNFGVTTGADTVTIPASGSATFMVITTNDSTDEPDGSVTATLSRGTGYTVSGTNNAATVAASDDDDPPQVTPTISISAGSSITEGCDASFTVTASPTPTSALIVYVTISQSGNFGATTGSRTITVPTSGSLTFTVSTANDNTDEPNGSVTATVTTGTGYTVSSNNGAAIVAVSDDDSAPRRSADRDSERCLCQRGRRTLDLHRHAFAREP